MSAASWGGGGHRPGTGKQPPSPGIWGTRELLGKHKTQRQGAFQRSLVAEKDLAKCYGKTGKLLRLCLRRS